MYLVHDRCGIHEPYQFYSTLYTENAQVDKPVYTSLIIN